MKSGEWNFNGTPPRQSNKLRHGVDFADAVGVFDDPHALTRADEFPDEERMVSLGIDSLARLLVVVWTSREDDIRIISARLATKRERRQYMEGT